LPYGQGCELGFGDTSGLIEEGDGPGWLKIGGHMRWFPHNTIPDVVLREMGQKPDGTFWNYRGILILSHNGKHFGKFE